jgi:hypothetical protein
MSDNTYSLRENEAKQPSDRTVSTGESPAGAKEARPFPVYLTSGNIASSPLQIFHKKPCPAK